MRKSIFVKFFGDAPLVRILDFLMENKLFDYTKTEIAKNSGISRVSLYTVWPAFTEHKIVRVTRRMGKPSHMLSTRKALSCSSCSRST